MRSSYGAAGAGSGVGRALHNRLGGAELCGNAGAATPHDTGDERQHHGIETVRALVHRQMPAAVELHVLCAVAQRLLRVPRERECLSDSRFRSQAARSSPPPILSQSALA